MYQGEGGPRLGRGPQYCGARILQAGRGPRAHSGRMEQQAQDVPRELILTTPVIPILITCCYLYI